MYFVASGPESNTLVDMGRVGRPELRLQLAARNERSGKGKKSGRVLG